MITRSRAARLASTSTTNGINNSIQSQPSASALAATNNQTTGAGSTASPSARPRRNRRLTEKAKSPDVDSEDDNEGKDRPSDDEYNPKTRTKLTKSSKARGQYAVRDVHHGMPEGNLLLWQRGYFGGIAQPRSVQYIADEVSIISGWTNVQGQSAETVARAQNAIRNAPDRVRKRERAALHRWIRATAGAKEAKKFLGERAAASKVNDFNPWETLLKYGTWRPSVTADTSSEDSGVSDNEADDEHDDEDAEEEAGQIEDGHDRDLVAEDSQPDDEDIRLEEEGEGEEEGEADKNEDGDTDMELFGEVFDSEDERDHNSGPISSVPTTADSKSVNPDSEMADATDPLPSEEVEMRVVTSGHVHAQADGEDMNMTSPTPSEIIHVADRTDVNDVPEGEPDADQDVPMNSSVIGEAEDNSHNVTGEAADNGHDVARVEPPSLIVEGVFYTDDPEIEEMMRGFSWLEW